MGVVFARLTQPCQPSPVPRPGRPAHRPFRGLLSVHSRCGLHTRTVTVCRDRYPKASDTWSPPCLLRSLPAGAVAGWGLHPLEKRRLVTAHVENGHCVSCGPQALGPSGAEIKKTLHGIPLTNGQVTNFPGHDRLVIFRGPPAVRPHRGARIPRTSNARRRLPRSLSSNNHK